MKKIVSLVLMVLLASMLFAGGGSEEQTADAGGEITELNAAAIFVAGFESSWDLSWYESYKRVAAEKPYGLEITLDYTEGVWGDTAEQVMREYAETGKYEIIFATAAYSDQVANLKDIYPEILWVVHGSGNEGLGGNVYWSYMRVHEPSYLLGMLAGKMTQTDIIGVVGTFAFDDVNDQINAFLQGAKDANPDVKAKVSFIESWYDPVKGQEATKAQIAAGVDFSFQIAEAYEACAESDIYAFGNFMDVNYLAPDHIISSPVALWDPSIKWIIDEWYAYATEGTPYDGNTEARWFSMSEGGSDLAPFYAFESKIPADVKTLLDETKQGILDGSVTVPLNVNVPVSD